MDIEIITPPVADDADPIDRGLVTLTEAICQAHPEIESGYGLGGRFGYGADFENDVFVMRRFYWGECDCGWMELEEEWANKHKHADDCYWNVSRRLIEGDPLTKARKEALAERDKHDWLSPKRDAAQKRVSAVCDALNEREQEIRKELCEKHGIAWDDGRGSAVHCTCGHDRLWAEFLKEHPGHKPTCSLELPNFLHKRTGLEVRWYKWIGRDTEVKNTDGVDINAVFSECLSSVTAPT